jgi:hypothetical protein
MRRACSIYCKLIMNILPIADGWVWSGLCRATAWFLWTATVPLESASGNCKGAWLLDFIGETCELRVYDAMMYFATSSLCGLDDVI